MEGQPSLFDALQPVHRRNGARGRGLEEQFRQFHRENPQVYARLRALALGLRARGVRRYGIAGLFEVLRWEEAMKPRDAASDFRLNNNYRSFYARLLMDNEPKLADFFETREQTWRTHEV
jgi:hypothetical protein